MVFAVVGTHTKRRWSWMIDWKVLNQKVQNAKSEAN